MSSISFTFSKEKTASYTRSEIYGESTGKRESNRISFEGFSEEKYRVAVCTHKPFWFSSRFFELTVDDVSVWVNKNSFKKRFSCDPIAVNFLAQRMPELEEKLKPLSCSIHENRIELIQTTIREYCPNNTFSDKQIAEFCRRADQAKGPTKISANKKDVIDRSILVGPDNEKFLLLTSKQDEILGRGGSKKVKFAVDLNNGEIKVVAICKKKNIRNKANWAHTRRLIRRELDFMKKCNFNEKIKLDFYYTQKTKEEKLYLIMPYCNGGELTDNQYSATEIQKNEWIGQIGNGLKKLHSKGILHRDIKPQNIFIQNGKAKIGDFGLACLKTEHIAIKLFCGTLAYLAPEKWPTGKKIEKSTEKGDVWSFGCTIFELLTNTRFLASGEDLLSIRSKDEKFIESRINSAELDEKYRPLLRGLLAIDPTTRWDMAQFVTEFDKLRHYNPEPSL